MDSPHWRRVWECKGRSDLTLAAISGRSAYGQREVDLLAEDAILALGLNHHSILLDVGCAAGLLARNLRATCWRYVGCDYSYASLARFVASADRVCGDALRLPFRDGSFSHGLMSSVLLCMTHDEAAQALRELRRVVSGTAFVSGNPNVSCRPTVASDLEPTWYAPAELAAMALCAGWSRAETRSIHPGVPHSRYMFDLLLR